MRKNRGKQADAYMNTTGRTNQRYPKCFHEHQLHGIYLYFN